MHKEDVVYMHDGISFSHKKKGVLLFVTTWTVPEGIMESKISQAEKDKYFIISLAYIIPKKTDPCKQSVES